MALNSLEIEEGLQNMEWGSSEHLHAAIESMRLGFADALQYNADPSVRHFALPPPKTHPATFPSWGTNDGFNGE